MIGKITGKTSTKKFDINLTAPAKKRDYVQTKVNSHDILAQITEIETTQHQKIAHCNIIGKRENNKLTPLMDSPNPNTKVELADPKFVDKTLGLSESEKGAFLGILSGYKDIKVKLDLNKFLKTHTAVLAKTGGGKSFCISTIIEELIEKKVPIIIIDPHGEYNSLAKPSKNTELLKKFDLEPKSYQSSIKEYSPDPKINKSAQRLTLNQSNLSAHDLIEMLPAKLSNTQIGIIYSALKEAETPSLDAVKLAVEMQEHPGKYTIINTIDYLKKLRLFSNTPTTAQDLIKVGQTSIINLRGVPPEIQEITVHKLLTDLFEERKKSRIPPFFLVVEEAHNYIPERSYKQAKSSKVLRQIFAEGRKFGIGACIVTQRPSRVEKNALSQVATQIILKVTNPSDIKAIANSSEGVTEDMEGELKGLEIGVAMIIGAFEIPVFVNIRPRKTSHGGESIDILEQIQKEKDTMPLIYKTIPEKPTLIPAVQLEYGSHKILINLNNLKIIKSVKPHLETDIPKMNISSLSDQQRVVFELAKSLDKFKAADLFARSNLQFSDLFETLKSLEEKGLLVKDEEFYKAKKVNIADFENFEDIAYESIEYAEIKKKNFNLEDIKKKFNEPDDSEECFVVV